MKILVRLPNWLGDILMSLAFIDALNKVYPKCEIGIIVKKELRDIVSYYDNKTKIYEFSKAEFPGLLGTYRFGQWISKKYKYELFFCLPNSFSSAWMGFFTRSKIRIGYKKEFRDFLLTHSYRENADLHQVEKYVNLLNRFTGIQWTANSITLKKPLNRSNLLPKGKNLLLNINSDATSRRMPIDLAKRLIIEIHRKYAFNFILTGRKQDIPFGSQLESELNFMKSVFNYTGKTDLLDLIKLVSEVDYIISTDSGVAHLGNAFSKKTVVIFGAGNEDNTRPYNTKNLRIIRKKGLNCAPCVSNNCKYKQPICLVEIDTNLVLKAMDALIENRDTSD
jgi:lipopolysaccharide heptosyltransferase II